MSVDGEMPAVNRSPGIAWCLAQLVLVKLSLRVFGFGRTLARYAEPAGPVRLALTVDDPLVDQIASRVAAAAALYPGRARCLEQSLTLQRELRRCGADSRLRFGVHPYPFAAHAWVEIRGRPVNEVEGMIEDITPLEEQ
jgi:hypothetical protein